MAYVCVFVATSKCEANGVCKFLIVFAGLMQPAFLLLLTDICKWRSRKLLAVYQYRLFIHCTCASASVSVTCVTDVLYCDWMEYTVFRVYI